ncbi:MAG TPA: cysteine desulfurase family protein [Candidatus Paceibacterota bacterium]|nr:cysteine desulfurase family protein [Candidatus Paceibacterota bacterium]
MKLWRKRIYADAAAATPLSRAARRELLRLLELYGNPSALHDEAVAAKRELEAARERAAKAIGAHADEIVFTSGGTEGNNLAIFGVLRRLLRVGEDVRAITSAVEHASVLEPMRALQKEGLDLVELPVDSRGFVSHKELREALTHKTALVSLQMVNSEVGTVQDIRELAKEIRHARKERLADALPLHFHTDASQAPLWLPLGADRLGIDFMTLDAQKMLGPKGAGLLYARRGTRLEPHIYGGGQERGYRSGTENVALAGSLAAALEEAQTGVKERAERVSAARDYFFDAMHRTLPKARIHGPQGPARVANNANISIPGLDGDMAVVALNAQGIAASVRSACDTDDESPSHVLKAIGVPVWEAKQAIRLTFLPDVSRGEARRIAGTLARIAARYRHR